MNRARANTDLLRIYRKLLKHFGKQHWWPAATRFEMIIGAILVQRTTWKNVEHVIKSLKDKDLVRPNSLASAALERVEDLIRPIGFYKQKAKRIVDVARYLVENYGGSLDKLLNKAEDALRKELLSLKGIGLETADSILLYAANKLVFPIDAYTKRVCKRLGLKELECEKQRKSFQKNLPKDLEVYREFRALIVRLGKTYCKSKPLCSNCPLTNECKSER